MAPSTATPSNLHRAPVACLNCRTAKVRCLVHQQADRCNRCISNDVICAFTRPKRARARKVQYAHEPQPGRSSSPRQQIDGDGFNGHNGRHDGDNDDLQRLESGSPTSWPRVTTDLPPQRKQQKPLITPDIRARIVAALATLRGKRGAPFSFITSGEQPPSRGGRTVSGQPSLSEPSMKLSSLLRPLNFGPRGQTSDDGRQSCQSVKMPSYISSLSLSQTIRDPIEGGMLTPDVSAALFHHFLSEMNMNWEYILDPRIDTHDDVRKRSPLLFATVLFCSSKFAGHSGRANVPFPTTDPYLQTRLCSLARSLAIDTFARGDRSIETMQAFYLLVCWKDPDDDVSYLHSGYAFRVMQDLNLKQEDGAQQDARTLRTWLALYRQDKQQSLFFVRKPYMGLGDEEPSFLIDPKVWLQNPRSMPLDFVGCCSAHVRRVQSKLRVLVRKASPSMLPCLLDLMETDLSRWRTTWQNHFDGLNRSSDVEGSLHLQALLQPGNLHLNTLLDLWEHSVRLNVSSAILRQTLAASASKPRSSSQDQASSSSPGPDLPGIGDVSSADVPGLRSCVEGAFGTLRSLLAFPAKDLRRAPDAVLLLGPHAALFLCLLLVFPCDGIVGVGFQKTATGLINGIARHVGQCIESPQDIANLHFAYLESLDNLVSLPGSDSRDEAGATNNQSSQANLHSENLGLGHAELQAAQDLADLAGPSGGGASDEGLFTHAFDFNQEPGAPDLASLLDNCFCWDMPAIV